MRQIAFYRFLKPHMKIAEKSDVKRMKQKKGGLKKGH